MNRDDKNSLISIYNIILEGNDNDTYGQNQVYSKVQSPGNSSMSQPLPTTQPGGGGPITHNENEEEIGDQSVTKQELDAIYYGSMIASSHNQSNFANTLWRLGERERQKNKLDINDPAFRNNRSNAESRLKGL